MKKILMVCLGNICRSPMAEGILRKKANEKGVDIEIDSAGTSDYHVGDPPDIRALEKAKAHDINIDLLKARQFTMDDFDRFDNIYVMDASNYGDVLALARNEADKQKVKMILDLIEPGKFTSVPDPYFGGTAGFNHVYQLLDQACEKIVDKLI